MSDVFWPLAVIVLLTGAVAALVAGAPACAVTILAMVALPLTAIVGGASIGR